MTSPRHDWISRESKGDEEEPEHMPGPTQRLHTSTYGHTGQLLNFGFPWAVANMGLIPRFQTHCGSAQTAKLSVCLPLGPTARVHSHTKTWFIPGFFLTTAILPWVFSPAPPVNTIPLHLYLKESLTPYSKEVTNPRASGLISVGN